MIAETIALAAPDHVRGTRRHRRVLRELCCRFPEALVVEAKRLDPLPGRLVFLTDNGMIDLDVFQSVRDCDEAEIPVFLLDKSDRLIPRDRLRLKMFEHSTRRMFAHVEMLRDRRVNPKAFA